MYYSPAKFGDDKSDGFCVIMLTYAHLSVIQYTVAAKYTVLL